MQLKIASLSQNKNTHTESPAAPESRKVSQKLSGIKTSVGFAIMACVQFFGGEEIPMPKMSGPRVARAADGMFLEMQPVYEEVDLIEINYFYDGIGRLVFGQIIYYDWSEEAERYQVRDWRLLKNSNQIPRRDWRDGGYVSQWHDFKQYNGLRKIRAISIRTTWTQHDPELMEREILTQEKRHELMRIRRPQSKKNPPPEPQHF